MLWLEAQGWGLPGWGWADRAATLTTSSRPHQAFTVLAIWNTMRLSVFFIPFSVKGLTESKSAAERFKVSGQGGLPSPWQWAFTCLQPGAFLLSAG